MDLQRTQQRTQQPEMEQMPISDAMVGATAVAYVSSGICPKCGTRNDSDALFCSNCGGKIRENVCPYCNNPIEPGTDFCEVCHRYVCEDHCSFCSSPLSQSDSVCPECGAPRSGIECPVCRTISNFAFCPSCGNALTDKARQQQKESWDVPFLNEVRGLESELERLMLKAPVRNDAQRKHREANVDIRNTVLALLENDGEALYERVRESEPFLNEDQLKDIIEQKRRQLQELLDRMAMPEQPTPAQARLIGMACKPTVSRLAWRCNYKDALHSSPLGCACPQKGGKWIVLGNDGKEKVQNDL